MFQFRRFPSYTYLFQYMIHAYCTCVFPHSDISGSKLICSSPKLFAACHVLHRLLMPRHSPCALFCLTFLEQSPVQYLVLLNYAGSTEVFNKIVFTLRQRKLRFPPPAFRRASGPLRFLFLFAPDPLAPGSAASWGNGSLSLFWFSELCRLNRSSSYKIVFTLSSEKTSLPSVRLPANLRPAPFPLPLQCKPASAGLRIGSVFFHNAVSVRPSQAAPSVALLFSFLCSVFKVH